MTHEELVEKIKNFFESDLGSAWVYISGDEIQLDGRFNASDLAKLILTKKERSMSQAPRD